MITDPLHTISVFVANKPGVLLRVAIIFARRGFNIESLVVSSALDGRFSRMTITAKGKEEILEQIVKQLNKLVDVVHAHEYIQGDSVSIETALLKILVKSDVRTEVLQVVDHFKATTLDLTDESLIVQMTAESDRVDALLEMLSKFDVVEVVRSGKMVMVRGQDAT